MQFDVGRSLKSVRERHGCSLRDLEKLSGYSRGYLNDIEIGRRAPKPFTLRCILDVIVSEGERNEILAKYNEFQAGLAC